MKKQPYALLINDIHVSKDNIPEFILNWNEALDICVEYKIPNIVIGGDLWQSRSSQTLSALLAVRSAITKATHTYDIKVTIAEGNHDKVDQEALAGYSHLFGDYDGVSVVDDFYFIEMHDNNNGGCTDLCVMSYFPENGSFFDRYKQVVAEMMPDRKSVLYIHQGINGGLSTPSDDELPANMFEEFDSVLVGHYHDRKKIVGTNVEYIGASRQHNFGEDEEKGYTILYTDGTHEFIKNQANIRYKVIDVDFENVDNNLKDEIEKIKSDSRYRVKLRIHCAQSQSSLIDKNKLVDLGVTKIEVVCNELDNNTNNTNSGLSKKYDKNEIKEEYTNFCSGKGVSDVELGLSYLDKINSLCGN